MYKSLTIEEIDTIVGNILKKTPPVPEDNIIEILKELISTHSSANSISLIINSENVDLDSCAEKVVDLMLEKNNYDALKILLNMAEKKSYKKSWRIYVSCILFATENNQIDVVRLLFQNPKIDPIDINRALLIAVKKGFDQIVELLLGNPVVDPTIENNSAIKIAAQNGFIKIVQLLLLDYRVDPTVDDNCIMQTACLDSHIEIVRLLLKDYRIDPTCNNNEAMIIALINGHFELTELLMTDRRIDPSYLTRRIIRDHMITDAHIDSLNVLCKDHRVQEYLYDENTMDKILRLASPGVVKFYIGHPQINVFEINFKAMDTSLFYILYKRFGGTDIIISIIGDSRFDPTEHNCKAIRIACDNIDHMKLLLKNDKTDLTVAIVHIARNKYCDIDVMKLLLSDKRSASVPVQMYKELILHCTNSPVKKLLKQKIDDLENNISYPNLDRVKALMKKCGLQKIDITKRPNISYSRIMNEGDIQSNVQSDAIQLDTLVNLMIGHKIVKIKIGKNDWVYMIFGH